MKTMFLCTQKIEIEREKYWMKKADQSFDQRTDSFYKISIPGIWKGNMRDFCGTVYWKRSSLLQKNRQLHLQKFLWERLQTLIKYI